MKVLPRAKISAPLAAKLLIEYEKLGRGKDATDFIHHPSDHGAGGLDLPRRRGGGGANGSMFYVCHSRFLTAEPNCACLRYRH